MAYRNPATMYTIYKQNSSRQACRAGAWASQGTMRDGRLPLPVPLSCTQPLTPPHTHTHTPVTNNNVHKIMNALYYALC